MKPIFPFVSMTVKFLLSILLSTQHHMGNAKVFNWLKTVGRSPGPCLQWPLRVWLLITMRTPWDHDFLGSPVWAECHSRTSFSGDNLSKENSFVPSAHNRCHLFNLGVAHRASCLCTQCLASLSRHIALHLFISDIYFLSTSFTESLLCLLTRLRIFKSFHAAFYSRLSLYPRL